MKRDIGKYLEDVLLSILDIQQYSSMATSSDDIETNRMMFDALCRRFSIIGEAIYQANKMQPTLAITDKNKIIGLRHLIVHEYDTIRAETLWDIIETNLNLLKTEVEDLLNRN